MTYFIVFLILVSFSIFEYYTQSVKIKKRLFLISAVFVLLFCVLRYGVGFDYFAYEYIFDALPNSFIHEQDLSEIHGEILFLYIFIFFKSIGISYPIVNALIILIINLFYIRFISKYSPYKCFSLLILFSFHFVYIFSMLRQGLAMSSFLCFAIPLLEKKQYLKYYLTIFLLTLLHTSIIIVVIIPVLLKYKEIIKKNELILLFLCFLIAIIPNSFLPITAETISQGMHYVENASINYFALINRTLLFMLIYFLSKPEIEKYKDLKYIYLLGFLIYLITAQSDFIASRISASLKSFEVILIPLILVNLPKKLYPFFILFFSIYAGVIFMNLISGIAGLSGYDNCLEYPYKMLFGKEYFFDER